jgi:lycopene cyclase domain-containing protein
MPVYSLFLLIFFAVPGAILAMLLRRELVNYKRTILWCYVFVYTAGLLWDWLSHKTGLWRYDSAKVIGIWLDGLPVEEFVGFYLLGTFLIIGITLVIRKRVKNV